MVKNNIDMNAIQNEPFINEKLIWIIKRNSEMMDKIMNKNMDKLTNRVTNSLSYGEEDAG